MSFTLQQLETFYIKKKEEIPSSNVYETDNSFISSLNSSVANTSANVSVRRGTKRCFSSGYTPQSPIQNTSRINRYYQETVPISVNNLPWSKFSKGFYEACENNTKALPHDIKSALNVLDEYMRFELKDTCYEACSALAQCLVSAYPKTFEVTIGDMFDDGFRALRTRLYNRVRYENKRFMRLDETSHNTYTPCLDHYGSLYFNPDLLPGWGNL